MGVLAVPVTAFFPGEASVNCSCSGVPMGTLCMEEYVLPGFVGRFFSQSSKTMKESNKEFFLLIAVIHCNPIKYDPSREP